MNSMVGTSNLNEVLRPAVRRDLRIGRITRDQQGQKAIVIQDPIFKGLMHPGYRVSPQVATILKFLDGTTSLQELATRVYTETGLKVTAVAIERFIRKLEQFDLLDTPDTRYKRNKLEAEFAEMEIRPPSDAGDAFYPKKQEMLQQAIQDCFLDKSGPGSLPVGTMDMQPTGLILPHAAITVSGTCTAWALHRLSHSRLPDLYIILGHNHVYPGPPRAEILTRPFQTPLGKVMVDQPAASTLMELAKDNIVLGPLSQYRDHSIEIELPFLQWLHSHSANTLSSQFSIVPLLITGERHLPGMREPQGHQEVWSSLAEVLAQFLSICNQRVVLVASGDFVHWGNLFNFTPFDAKSDEDFYNWDRPLLEAVNTGSAEQFLEAWQATNSCVGRPAYIVLKALSGHSWSMANYHVGWTGDTAISFASYVAYTP